MSSLALYFCNEVAPQLQETVFSHPFLLERRHAVRGKGIGLGGFSFQWTAALQALCLLLLSYKRLGAAARLRGERGSPASSLDYSLSKRTEWLKDLFGCTRRGELIAQRFLRRVNTECRHGCAVELRVNPQALPLEELRIFLNEKEVLDADAILSIEQAIQRSWKPKLTVIPQANAAPQPSAKGWPELVDLFERELSAMLTITPIFQRPQLAAILERVARHPSILNVTRKPLQFVSSLDLELAGSARLGLDGDRRVKRALSTCPPIKVALAGSQVGALTIFKYLRDIKRYNFEINYEFPYAIEIKRKIVAQSFADPPDLCVLGIAPAASLMAWTGKQEYAPLMLMPSMSHALIAPQNGEAGALAKWSGQMLLLREEPSTSLFYLEDLQRQALIKPSQFVTRHVEPDEVASELAKGDNTQQAVLFFPFYSLNQLCNTCHPAANISDPLCIRESVLFAQARLLGDTELSRCVDIAIRDAWLELLSNALVRRRLINSLMSDSQYLRFLYRTSGMRFMRHPLDDQQLAA